MGADGGSREVPPRNLTTCTRRVGSAGQETEGQLHDSADEAHLFVITHQLSSRQLKRMAESRKDESVWAAGPGPKIDV